MKVLGIDGCRTGWCCVVFENDGPRSLEIFENISQVWDAHHDASQMLIDMPIGLPERRSEHIARVISKQESALVRAAPVSFSRHAVMLCTQPATKAHVLLTQNTLVKKSLAKRGTSFQKLKKSTFSYRKRPPCSPLFVRRIPN